MNQPALQGDNTWGNSIEGDAQAQILVAWRESNEPPGKYLKQLRELRGKSPQEMASELGVSLTQLNALENDIKEELPAPIYVKSYIKRYCLCLGISESEYATMLDEISKEVQPTLSRVSIRENINGRQVVMRWIGYALMAAIVLLLVFWLKSMDLTGLWQTITSTSLETTESTATELSLPVIVEEVEPSTVQEVK